MLKGKKYLIVAACESELTPARDSLADYPNFYFATLGIGLVQAAIGATREIRDFLTRENMEASDLELIFIGSVGSVNNSIPLLSLVSASKSILHEPSSLEGKTFLVDKMRTELSPLHSLFADLARKEIISTSLGITCSPALAEKILRKTKATCENLELFALASAASEINVSWSSLSCVTNHLDQEAHSNWQKNHLQAAEITASTLKTWASILQIAA